jgi:hypothetical protein
MQLEKCKPIDADYALIDIDTFTEIDDKHGPFHYILCYECAEALIKLIENKKKVKI